MTETSVGKRQPILALIATAVTALSLFTPMMLVTLPVMVAVALSIGAVFRKEKPAWLPYVAGGCAIMLLALGHLHPASLSHESQDIKASAIYNDAKWQYNQTKDDMRGTVSKNAMLFSPTDLDLPPPYEGGNSVNMFVSDSSGIMLSVEKGQFQCGTNESVSVKVDGGPVWSYPCSMNDNGQTNYLFVDNQISPDSGQPSDPRDLLTRGKKMTVECPSSMQAHDRLFSTSQASTPPW